MGDAYVEAARGQARANLQGAAGVAGNDARGAAGDDVIDLALAQAARHGRLGEVVAPRAATADVGLAQLDELQSRNACQQLPRRRADALRVGEVAGVVS